MDAGGWCALFLVEMWVLWLRSTVQYTVLSTVSHSTLHRTLAYTLSEEKNGVACSVRVMMEASRVFGAGSSSASGPRQLHSDHTSQRLISFDSHSSSAANYIIVP